jgi:predicted nucleic acid-binding protein
MKRHLLDTGPLGAYLFNRHPIVETVSPWITAREVQTSILVYGELTEYLRAYSHPARHQTRLRRLMQTVEPRELNLAIMERYADLRRAMRPPYGPGLIGDIDTLIAATALVHRLTVITLDHDFERVPGLDVTVLAT